MEKLTYTSANGDVIHFYGPPFYLISVNGLGDVEADNQLQKYPFQDGGTRVGSLLSERVIPVEFLIEGKTYKEVSEARVRLARAFNPKLELGILRYDNGFIVREIKACAESVPIYPDGSGNRAESIQKGIVTLLCPNPYWKSLEVVEEPAFQPLFQFPFEGTFEMGVQRDQRIIFNDGDAPAPLQVEFFGPAVNPVIRNNTTGEFIKINQTLQEGEVMQIDTTPGDKSVYFIGTNGSKRNVFNWITPDSTFFSLIIGENEIQYSADSDIQGRIVNISYSKLYNAV